MLSLPRILQNYNSTPSTGASISSTLGLQIPDHLNHFHGFNFLQLLQIPRKNLVIAFFPTGENSNQVGFTLISVKDGILSLDSKSENHLLLAKEGCENHQITQLLVNSIDDDDDDDDDEYEELGDKRNNNGRNNVVGYLMVCTKYSVYWYSVLLNLIDKFSDFSVSLDYLGCGNNRTFKGKEVVSTCWSPHLKDECLVLLENGDLLLFDVSDSCAKKAKLMSMVTARNKVLNKKIQVSLNSEVDGSEGWFGCDFSWHPRIFIVSHRDAIFLVDSRSSKECKINCLLKLEKLSMSENDGFMALSRAGSDRFHFTVATKFLLLLCDIRKPLMPILRWAHELHNSRFMTVFKLSQLRTNAEDDKHNLASESGHCILLGSFWDNEFSLFFYGPDINKDASVYSEVSKSCDLYYAWGLPSELSLSGSDCNCGNCLVKEDFTKGSLPNWVDWRQKKELVWGFGILEADLTVHMATPDNFSGGFVLIRLTSSGKIEAQQYNATWESEISPKVSQKRKSIDSEDDNNLLCVTDDSEFDDKKYQHLKFEFLGAYLKDKLAKYMAERREKIDENREVNPKKYPIIKMESKDSDLLNDIYSPTSIHEIASISTWASLPTNLLQLAFCTYSDFPVGPTNRNEPLEFLSIPDEQHKEPPFPLRKSSNRSNKWSSKCQPSDSLVGPVLPPQFLTTLHKLCLEEFKKQREPYLEETEHFSPDSMFKLECEKVMEIVKSRVLGSDSKTHEDEFLSLDDDLEEMTEKPKFSYHKPSASLEDSSEVDLFSTHVFRRNQELEFDLDPGMVGREVFDLGCPVELKFQDQGVDFGPKEMELYRNLKKLELDFQRSFKPYQDYISRENKL